MPLDRFVLLIVIVIAAAGATLGLALIAASFLEVPAAGLTAAIPALLVGYVIWRVVAARIGNKEDDHYDRIER